VYADFLNPCRHTTLAGVLSFYALAPPQGKCGVSEKGGALRARYMLGSTRQRCTRGERGPRRTTASFACKRGLAWRDVVPSPLPSPRCLLKPKAPEGPGLMDIMEKCVFRK